MKKLFFLAIILFLPFLKGWGGAFAQTTNKPGSGNCLAFDGLDDYISVPHNNSFDFGSADFTISCWVKFLNITDQSQGLLVHAVDGASASNGWAFVWNGGDLNFYNGMAGGPVGIFGAGTYTPILNQWVHLSVVRSGNNWEILENGIIIRSTTYSGTIGPVNTDLFFARGITYTSTNIWVASLNFFSNIELDEMQIWNRALTQTEIQTNMCKKLPDNYGNGLVGYWRFDEGIDNTCPDGQDACDASGNGNNGVKF